MHSQSPPDGRAQTTLDFAIAMGVFLLAVAFVFTFIPSLTAPFVDGNQEQSAIADRVATNLVEGQLADPDEPYVLNVTCTTAFFENSSQDGCGYRSDPGIRQRIGVSDRPKVNVTLVTIDADTRDRTLLCDDGADGIQVGGCSDPYQVGGDHSNAESITVARRVVTIDGTDATLFVRVW
jgi:hypothetical protein